MFITIDVVKITPFTEIIVKLIDDNIPETYIRHECCASIKHIDFENKILRLNGLDFNIEHKQ